MTVYLHGTGIIPFGRYRDRTLEDLAVPAAADALAEAAAASEGIDAVYCGNVYGGMLPAHRIAARLGLTGRPAYNVEAACSSSAVALHLAVTAIRAGQFETALVIGVEQLSVFGRGTLRLNADDPEMSSAKRADASRALLRMRDWRAEHAAMCRRGLHRLADVGLTTAGSCAECDRMNRRAKYREANPLREKTHCKSGEHELTPENTYLWRGVKCCKACRRDNKKGQSGHRIKRQRVISVLHKNPGQSNRQIARLLGVSHNLVGTVRKQMVAEKVLGMP